MTEQSSRRGELSGKMIWYCAAHCYEATDHGDARRHQNQAQSLCDWRFIPVSQVSPEGASDWDLAVENGELCPDPLFGITIAPGSLVSESKEDPVR